MKPNFSQGNASCQTSSLFSAHERKAFPAHGGAMQPMTTLPFGEAALCLLKASMAPGQCSDPEYHETVEIIAVMDGRGERTIRGNASPLAPERRFSCQQSKVLLIRCATRVIGCDKWWCWYRNQVVPLPLPKWNFPFHPGCHSSVRFDWRYADVKSTRKIKPGPKGPAELYPRTTVHWS